MRAVVSTVSSARVTVDGETVGQVDAEVDGEFRGALLALVGVGRGDGPEKWSTVARKIAELRLLPPRGGSWSDPRNVSVTDNDAAVLVVSQFTLAGSTVKGRRPSWSGAAPAAEAEVAVDTVVAELRARGVRVATGRFGAEMSVESVNEGPFTVVVEA
ncbi:D-aminoacyl-tRNA deacylase [Corynebacterium provencense]|uniref:D-aminoacyl-tRNA deacylase n=1 Tax=Corynebacterium provencense TaxID=1737425 RepID=A0A2Z3YTX8_9CORY|nr:D-aminoacyl-tRNA deacylase [Corynebacterium provencense]AWT26064.1 D-aminoacyl-tRNA deacylase [Corynebacterium provencense]MCI1256062.1 D-aminoacyl-tRNA deacylase [Corynebacterium provencense]